MPKNYVYTDLSVKKSLYLEVDGVGDFEVSQFSCGWAANEIPTAACMLAIGRDVRTQLKAKLHDSATKLKTMRKARVWFEPKGEYDREVDWPAGKRKIFEGYFTGFAYRKINGKVTAIGNLIHWLAALGFSSTLTEAGHVSNPTSLNAAAVLPNLGDPGAGEGAYIGNLTLAPILADQVTTDLWKGIKEMFCALAAIPALSPVGTQGECGGAGDGKKNDVALEALSRIEGPAKDCNKAYKRGVALPLDTKGVNVIEDSIATGLSQETVESYSTVSFWDKMVGQLFPSFGMAIVPMVESAIVVADTPAYRTQVWREIQIDDEDSFDLTRESHRPLRAVGVVGGYISQTKAGVQVNGEDEGPPGRPDSSFAVVGGCYAEDSVAAGDGMIMYVSAPPWLQVVGVASAYAAGTQGLKKDTPVPTGTTPGLPAKSDLPTPASGTVGDPVNELFTKYAHEVFVNQMLRGQSGAFSGKLRFDIAPLSIVRVRATTEKFIGPGQDDLAEPIVGCVQRVTISINAEAGMAGTSFQLSHVRTATENKEDRTSVTEHPLFGKAIHGGGKHGCPLVEDYEFPLPPQVAPPPRPVGG